MNGNVDSHWNAHFRIIQMSKKDKIMKKNKYILLLIVAAFLVLPACQDQLDDIKPQQSLSDTDAFLNKASTQSVLLGVYSSAQVLDVYGSMPQIISDFMADNGRFVGSFPTLQELRDFNAISTNTSVANVWLTCYRVVLRANLVIANVPKVEDVAFTDAERAQYIAEAKFMRALINLTLVNLFAQPYQVSQGSNAGIPLLLDPFEGIVDFPARSTVNEVHAQISKDLTEAIPGLPDSYSDGLQTRGRATKGAARALLSRLHLYRGEWSQAADFAKQVLDNATLYAPATDYSFWGSKNTTEDVFTIQNSNIDNGRTGSGGWASFHQPASLGGRGDVTFSESLIAAYEEEDGDKRFDLKITGVDASTVSSFFTTKWSDAVNNADNSPVIRTTEVILNYVEAKAEADNAVSQDLIDRINVLRTRAGLPGWVIGDFATKDAFVTAVLNERRKELAFEGHRRMDMLRRGQNLRTDLSAAAFGSDMTVLPIPQRELDINPNLTGNPGY